MTGCLKACEEKACSTDLRLTKGCDKKFSCSHGCKIRSLGVNQNNCKTHCDQQTSGCNPIINSHRFKLCKSCKRTGDNCSASPSADECKIGCTYY